MSASGSFRVAFASDRAGTDAEGPLVAVVVSLFNYAPLVTETLDSILGQTHPRLELVVVDDASTDGSEAVATSWLQANADRFERARLLRHDRNLGLSVSRNLAFKEAQARLVMVMDADNLLEPRAIGRLVEALEDSGAAVAYSQLEHFGDGRGIGAATVWTAEGFAHDNYVDAMALVRKDAWARVGGFVEPDRGGWEDYDFWCRFVEAGLQGVYVPELLCRYRVHAGSMLQTRARRPEFQDRLIHLMVADHPWLKLRP